MPPVQASHPTSHLAEAIVDLQKFARTLAGKIKPSRVRHDRAADVVEFVGKSDGVALAAIVTLRLLPAEKDLLAMDAEMAGITRRTRATPDIWSSGVSEHQSRDATAYPVADGDVATFPRGAAQSGLPRDLHDAECTGGTLQEAGT